MSLLSQSKFIGGSRGVPYGLPDQVAPPVVAPGFNVVRNGASFAGGEFDVASLPTTTQLQSMIDRGVAAVRIPYKRAKVLDGTYTAVQIATLIKYLTDRGVMGAPDDHSYTDMSNPAIGTFQAEFAKDIEDFYTEANNMAVPDLLVHYIQNEPASNWPAYGQGLKDNVAKMRAAGVVGTIAIDWGFYSKYTEYDKFLAALDTIGGHTKLDPLNNWIASMHDYWEPTGNDQSGDVSNINIATRYAPMITAFRARGLKLIVGEIGMGGGTPRWLPPVGGYGETGGVPRKNGENLFYEYLAWAEANSDVVRGTWAWGGGKLNPSYAYHIGSTTPVALAQINWWKKLPVNRGAGPTLTAASAEAAGSTGVELKVTTSEAGGKIYRYVSAPATPPSQANFISGTGSIAFASSYVQEAGIQSFLMNGLVPETAYHAHFLHIDATGDAGNVTTVAFTSGSADAWVPSDLGAKLLAWWDAKDIATIEQSAGAVGGWTDKVNGFTLAQATAANKPTYSANGLNGRACVSFDGVSDVLAASGVPWTTSPALPTIAHAETWSLVNQAAPGTDATTRCIFSYGGPISGQQFSVRRIQSGTSNRFAVTNGVATATAPGDYSGVQIVRGQMSNSSVKATLGDGSTATSNNATSLQTTRTRMGASANNTAAGFMHGDISVHIVTAPLTVAEANALRNWLKVEGNLIVTPVLGTLTLSGAISQSTPSTGTINGAFAGSAIVSNVSGLTVDSDERTYIWDGTGSAGTTANGLVETLAGATGSPKNSSITVAVAAGPGLSLPTASPFASSGADLSIVTNEPGGTLYAYVSTSGTPPSSANHKTGSGATSFSSRVPAAAGIVRLLAKGLTGATNYWVHYLHTGSNGIDSAPATQAFTSGSLGQWAPTSLGDKLLAWWDSEHYESLGFTAGDVSAWEDRVLGFKLSQATAANRPDYSATAFAGRPCVIFDGATSYLSAVGVPWTTSPALSNINHAEVWSLTDQATPATDTVARCIFSYGGPISGQQFSARRIQSGGTNAFANTNGVVTATAAGDFSGIHITRAQMTNSSVRASLDAGAVTSASNTTSLQTTRTRMGASANNTVAGFQLGSTNCNIVTAPLDAGEAAAMLAYLEGRM